MTLDRARFLAIVYNQPLLGGDAIALIAGEDIGPRIDYASGLFMHQKAAPGILVLGGKSYGPHVGAQEAAVLLMGAGVAPDRLSIDASCLHTRAQADALVREIAKHDWKQVLLVASHYHQPRVVLTVIKALTDAGLADTVRLVSVAASHARWFASPELMAPTRLDRFDRECEKVDAYAATGDCATWAEGVAYFRRMEAR